jgi:hypothetical protein
MKFLITLFLFVCINTLANAQKIYHYYDKNFSYKLVVDSVLSDDSVNYKCHIKSISIYKRSDQKLLQTISPPENSFFCHLPKEQVFIIEDINFDKVNDIRLIQFIPAAPNIPYYYWIFNSKTNRFQRNTSLEEITSPEFDHRNKIITSSWRGGWANYGASTYKYINNKPVLVEEYETKLDENNRTKHVITLKKRIHGKMKLVKRRVEIRTNDDDS